MVEHSATVCVPLTVYPNASLASLQPRPLSGCHGVPLPHPFSPDSADSSDRWGLPVGLQAGASRGASFPSWGSCRGTREVGDKEGGHSVDPDRQRQ